MQAALKKTKAKLDLLTGIDKLLMVEEDIRQGICHSIDMQKLIRDTWKIMIQIMNCCIFNIGM